MLDLLDRGVWPVFSRKPNPYRLEPPALPWRSLNLPDVAVMTNRKEARIYKVFAESVIAGVREGSIDQVAREFVDALAPDLLQNSIDGMTLAEWLAKEGRSLNEFAPVLTRCAATGFAVATGEQELGWAKPGLTDAKAEMVLSETSFSLPEGTPARIEMICGFLIRAAHYYYRMGGTEEAAAQLRAGLAASSG
jgi:hypothetical protein